MGGVSGLVRGSSVYNSSVSCSGEEEGEDVADNGSLSVSTSSVKLFLF